MGSPVETFRKQFSRSPGGAEVLPPWPILKPRRSFGGIIGTKSLGMRKKRDMNNDLEHLLSVSWASMGLPRGPAPNVPIKCESAVIPPLLADDYGPPEVNGVPSGAFVWSSREDERLFGAYAAALALFTPPLLKILGVARLCTRVSYQ